MSSARGFCGLLPTNDTLFSSLPRMTRMNTDILFVEHGCRGLTRLISDKEELRILVKEIILINHIGQCLYKEINMNNMDNLAINRN